MRSIVLFELNEVPFRIDGGSGSTAYHVPNGFLLVYEPRPAAAGQRRPRPQISILELAPAILANCGAPVPACMRGGAPLA